MLFEQRALFELKPPAWRSGGKRIKAPASAQARGQPPSQMCCAGFAAQAISQKKNRTSGTGGTHAKPTAGGEIENFMMPGNIGNYGRHRFACDRFFCRPEQLAHGSGPHQDQCFRIKTEAEHTRAIRQTHLLGILDELQIDDSRALLVQQAACLGQGKTEHRTSMTALVGEYLLQQACSGQWKAFDIVLHPDPLACFCQCGFALDIGNGFPQRGQALLVIGRRHRATFVNKTGTFRLRICAESSPFLCDPVWPGCISPGQDRVTGPAAH